MNGKSLKRKVKEEGLYFSFLKGLKQAEKLKLSTEYFELCHKLISYGFLKEFLTLVNDENTNGLKAFVGHTTGNFNHVLLWIKEAPRVGAIDYKGETLDYAQYMRIKNIVR